MSDIDELQSRITAALDRITKGLERRAEVDATPDTAETEPAETGALKPGDEAEFETLRQALEDEKLANAQLEARLKTLHDRLTAREADLELVQNAHAESLQKLDADLQSLRKANQHLRDNNQALREAHQASVTEPHLINKSMLAELEGLRAARAADRGEVESVLVELDRVISGASDDSGTKTEEA